jgi:alpha-ketoglutarate-dependent taurine dioxygenase
MDRAELQGQGWTVVRGVTSQTKLMDLARAIGRPKPSPTGELIKLLTPRPAAESRIRTLSAEYGEGEFPLHTDTAFWPLPSRYLIFRAVGDLRRPTVILSFSKLLQELGTEFRNLAERSIWSSKTPERAFYCSMTFKVGDERCWRYDSQCMFPVNTAAVQVAQVLRSRMPAIRKGDLDWSEGIALVLDNWKILHGRGPMPVGEKYRILERIYVE